MRSSSGRSKLPASLGLAMLLVLGCGPSAAQTVADHLAACKSDSPDLKGRIQACGRAIEGAQDNEELRAEALLQRGVLYEMFGDQEAAIADYSEILKIDASSAIAYFNRGNVRDRLGQPDLALKDYTEAIRLDPTDPDMFNNRGQVHDSRGDFDLAIADYSEAIRL
ncbi:MAG: tetratricopeptide repeat protein, partial [Hyphomicrobiaceae bacterium]